MRPCLAVLAPIPSLCYNNLQLLQPGQPVPHLRRTAGEAQLRQQKNSQVLQGLGVLLVRIPGPEPLLGVPEGDGHEVLSFVTESAPRETPSPH